MKEISFDNSEHIFIIAEAGSNWKCGSYDEDLNQAKKLISIASSAGADAVKFQTYRPETVYVQDAGKSKYLSKSGVDKDINQLFEHLSMPYEMIPELADYSEKKDIIFMSTPFSTKDAEEINPYVPIHKIASFEINHIRLIEYLLETKKPILISTGASAYDDIDFTINLIKSHNHDKIGLLQCTSKYPCDLKSLNLSVIPNLKSRYNLPIGLSDHSTDPIIGPIMAVGLGATIIEKHFTIDKNLAGPDHAFALTPNELELMIESVRKAELTKGNGIKEILDVEMELRQFATRSLQAIKKINKGDLLKEGKNFQVLRSGNRIKGLSPRFLSQINGKKSLKDIEIGDGIIEFE